MSNQFITAGTVHQIKWGSLHSIVTNVLDCNIIVNEFKLQLPYYVYFWTNTLGKGMNFLILTSYRLNSTTSFYKNGFGIK